MGKSEVAMQICCEYVQTRGKPKREDVRITVAHVLRVLLDAMPQGALAGSQREHGRLVDFANDTLKFLNGNPQGVPQASALPVTS